jgi:hypothetical protein
VVLKEGKVHFKQEKKVFLKLPLNGLAVTFQSYNLSSSIFFPSNKVPSKLALMLLINLKFLACQVESNTHQKMAGGY